MKATANGSPNPSAGACAVVALWLRHLLCLAIPLYALSFALTGPHDVRTAVAWMLPIWLTVLIDMHSPAAGRQPQPGLPGWPFAGILYALAAIQVANITSMLLMAGQLAWQSAPDVVTSLINLFAVKVVVGTTSGFSGIIVAHELIHRRQRHMRLLGRWLLTLVCYEHFATEHTRGHHRRVGTAADPATARFGESYRAFWRRTVPAQFKSAWRLEEERLARTSAPTWPERLHRHRVLHGVMVECAWILGIVFLCGIGAAAAFLLQAWGAVRKLEAANYFEHWGLSRNAGAVTAADAWDTDSWFTLYTLIGLSRHADHHRCTQTPFQELRRVDASPKLPCGYFASAFLSIFMNRRFQKLASQELAARGLGPFRKSIPGAMHAGGFRQPSRD